MKIKYLFLTMIGFAWTSGLFAQADMQEDIAMIKKNLADSKEKIRQYSN